MAHTARPVAVAMTLWILAVGAGEAAAERGITLVLQIVDKVGVPGGELAHAQAEAARIFEAIGVELVWAGQAATPSDLRALHLTVVLGTSQASDTASAPRNQHVLGAAMRPAGRAYVYVDRVRQLSSERQAQVQLLLGRAIAHEVGHLVLPKDGHSTSGIMTARLHTHRDGAALTFTESERMNIHARLLALSPRVSATP